MLSEFHIIRTIRNTRGTAGTIAAFMLTTISRYKRVCVNRVPLYSTMIVGGAYSTKSYVHVVTEHVRLRVRKYKDRVTVYKANTRHEACIVYYYYY